MKKLLSSILLLFSFILTVSVSNAASYEQALSSSKPAAILIYADWADNVQSVLQSFNNMGQQYADKYNFVPLNICKPEAKSFNKIYHIYPNIPYVLLFREGGKISRFLKQDCVTNESCFKEKLDVFAIK